MEKLRVLDLFSGAGGLSEGFRQAGFEIVGAIEFNEDSCKTFKINFPSAKVIHNDIKSVKLDENIFGKIDVIIGGPPCQGFSNLNRHNKNLEDDPRNVLFEEFLRFVDYFKPSAILIENVRGILTSKDGYAKKTIEQFFIDRNYCIDSKTLNASDFGVPQNRKRAFFVAFKKNLVEEFSFDIISKFKINEKVILKDLFSDLLLLDENSSNEQNYEYPIIELNHYLNYLRKGSNSIQNHYINYPSEIVQNRINQVPQGGNWRSVTLDLFPSNRSNRHSNYLKRLDMNSQSITIDTGHDVYFHPIYNRVPTVRESARIQSFPDIFTFTGRPRSQLRQVGNAVPPLMAKAIGLMIKELLDENS